MSEAGKKTFEPIKDEERVWADWEGVQKTFPIKYSTFKKYKKAGWFTKSKIGDKPLYDLTFMNRIVIYNMELSVLEQRMLEEWRRETSNGAGNS